MIKMAPSPIAPYVMRLELRPPVDAELEVSVLVPDDDDAVEDSVDETVFFEDDVELVVDEDVADAELLEVVVLHESEQS